MDSPPALLPGAWVTGGLALGLIGTGSDKVLPRPLSSSPHPLNHPPASSHPSRGPGAPRSWWGMLCSCPALPVAGLSHHLAGFSSQSLNSWIPSFLFTEVETGSQCDLNPRPEGMFWESGGKDDFLCGVWLPLPSRVPLQKDLCPDFITSTHLGAGRAPSGVVAERKAACSLCAGSVSACLHPTVISKTPVNKQFSSHRN